MRFTRIELLLIGHPSEITPNHLRELRASAERWSRRSELTDEERLRIKGAWVEQRRVPAIQLSSKRREQLQDLAP